VWWWIERKLAIESRVDGRPQNNGGVLEEEGKELKKAPDCEGRWTIAQGESNRGAILWMDRSRWWLEWGEERAGVQLWKRRGKEASSFCLRFRLGPPKTAAEATQSFPSAPAPLATGRPASPA
jgi:hypothetical protein